MPLLLVFTPAPKTARGVYQSNPVTKLKFTAVFLDLNFPVQKFSNLSIELHLVEGGQVSLPQRSQTQELFPG